MPSHTLCALTRLSPCIAHFVFGRRRLDVCTVLDGGNTQLDACAEDVMPPGNQDPLATLTTPYKSTPMGFEPTRGDPVGLAGRRLSLLAKVSSAKSASQLHSSPGSHVTVSLCFLCPPYLPISHALTDS